MSAMINALPDNLAKLVGVCLDTAHVWAAGYDLINDFDGVFQNFDDAIGLDRLECLHLNDSKAKLGSHLDRHDLIGEGSIGAEPFRRLMPHARLIFVPKVFEKVRFLSENTLNGQVRHQNLTHRTSHIRLAHYRRTIGILNS